MNVTWIGNCYSGLFGKKMFLYREKERTYEI